MPLSSFSPTDFPAYSFKDNQVFRGKRKLKPTSDDEGYTYYRLTDKLGKRVKVSENFVRQKITKVGSVYYAEPPVSLVLRYPDAWPMFGVDHVNREVYRVAFSYPRAHPQRLQPYRGGYNLLDHNMSPRRSRT